VLWNQKARWHCLRLLSAGPWYYCGLRTSHDSSEWLVVNVVHVLTTVGEKVDCPRSCMGKEAQTQTSNNRL